MVANNAKTGSWSALAEQRREESRNLTIARRAVGENLLPDLLVEERAIRVAAYRRQVEAAGQITAWLPAVASTAIRLQRQLRTWKRGRQYRWFDLR